jgi:hypothetical protein
MLRLCLICSSLISTWATAVPKQRTFLSWNLTVARPSSTLALMSSAFWMVIGNLPHLAKKAPPSLPCCLTKDSEMNNILYFAAHFFNSFPFLSVGSTFFLRESSSIKSIPYSLHLSMWAASAMTQTLVRE